MKHSTNPALLLTILAMFVAGLASGSEVKLTALDTSTNDYFGSAVSLAGDVAVITPWASSIARCVL